MLLQTLILLIIDASCWLQTLLRSPGNSKMNSLLSDPHFASLSARSYTLHASAIGTSSSMFHASTGIGSMQRSGSTSVGWKVSTSFQTCPACCHSRHCGLFLDRRPTQSVTYAVGKWCNDDHTLSDRFVRSQCTNDLQTTRKASSGAFASAASHGVPQ